MLVLVIILIAGALILLNQDRRPEGPQESTSPVSVESTPVNPDAILAETPPEAVTTHNSEASKNTICQSLKSSYQNIEDVKKREKVDLRFINVHKKVDGFVYRLRFFYKDSSENEIPSYLVYKENQNDEDILTEKTLYKKGKLYRKIEKAPGEIIYTEEGMDVGSAQDLFLHYENKVLKDLQGISPLTKEQDFIECRF